MKVKEFIEVVNFDVLYYAKIYEMIWNEDYQEYHSKYTGIRIYKLSDLDPYLECELEGFDLHLQYGEYDDSEIWIKYQRSDTKWEHIKD